MLQRILTVSVNILYQIDNNFHGPVLMHAPVLFGQGLLLLKRYEGSIVLNWSDAIEFKYNTCKHNKYISAFDFNIDIAGIKLGFIIIIIDLNDLYLAFETLKKCRT